jgi:hypothetical protein
MEPHDIVVGLVAGAVAVVFGIVPGLFSGLSVGVCNFPDSLLFGAPVHPHRLTEAERLQRPLGLAVFGALVIALTIVAYILN